MPPRRRPTLSAATNSSNKAEPSEHLAGFIHYLKAECGLSANTLLAYRRDLTRFDAWYQTNGPGKLQQVDLALLTRYLEDLHQHQFAATSIARHLAALKMFFRYLVLEGIIPESLVELVNSPKLWQHLPKVLSPEKVDALIAAPSREDRQPLRDRALLALMYATGCRASEVCGIALRDIHLEERYCRCVGKGNKERIVSLNPVACAAVEAYLQHEYPKLAPKGDPTSPLLVSRGGNPLSRITVWKLVKRYAARIGASREVSPHTLRHSFATHMLAGGAEIRALQELLGHASIRTTQIYTQVDHSRLKSIHEKCHPRG
ncbi:site-specific tyrosine recombinase XerD [Schlesneria sp. T3-172]|uniref:site-specific tyrosine recombinase XerD n=1 Tax=Schlesneria sphaerica TaxID=3373610 RepID=UPI0037CBAB17